MTVTHILVADDEDHPLNGCYMADTPGILLADASGNVANYDPEHPRVIERLLSGDLVRVQ